MNFDWLEFLGLADTLSRNPKLAGSEEASLRTAISRAYYAAYCTARNYLRDRGEITIVRHGSDHETVIRHLRRSPHKSRHEIGVILEYLRRIRNHADYDDEFPNLYGETHNGVMEANRAIQLLKRLK